MAMERSENIVPPAENSKQKFNTYYPRNDKMTMMSEIGLECESTIEMEQILLFVETF